MIPGCAAVPLFWSATNAQMLLVHVRDGMSLAAARGAVCKDGCVVTVKYAVAVLLLRIQMSSLTGSGHLRL